MKNKKNLFLILTISILLVATCPVYADSLCSEDGVRRTFMILGSIIRIIKIMIPVILLVISSITLIRVTMLGDDGEVKNAAIDLGKKLVLSLLIFFVPEIIEALISLVGNNYDQTRQGFTQCWDCFTGDSCSLKSIGK